MNNDLIAGVTVSIHAPADKVWDALTNPEMIKQYLFGTQVETDWKEGSPISYKGSWEGKEYEDKGIILKVVPEKLLESTYWSSMSGLEDKPENYKKVTYALAPAGDNTAVTITQDNNKTEDDKSNSEQNWTMVLDSLKKLLEKE